MTLSIVHNKTLHRFQAELNGEHAILEYMHRHGALALVHTYVPPEYRNRGIAFALVHQALEYAKAEHLKVIPVCSTVGLYIEEHPEYNELVDETTM